MAEREREDARSRAYLPSNLGLSRVWFHSINEMRLVSYVCSSPLTRERERERRHASVYLHIYICTYVYTRLTHARLIIMISRARELADVLMRERLSVF